MFWIIIAHREKGGGDFVRQRVVDATLCREAAVAVARTLPEDPQAIIGETSSGAQDGEGVPTDGARVIRPCGYQINHHCLIPAVSGGPVLMESVYQVPIWHQPGLCQVMIGQEPGLHGTAASKREAPPTQISNVLNGRLLLRNELGRKTDVDIAHGHDAAGLSQSPADLHVS